MSVHREVPRPALLRHADRLVDLSPSRLEAVLLQHQDPATLELLAHLATDGVLPLAQLRAAANSREEVVTLLDGVVADWRRLAGLARLLALMGSGPGDLSLGLALYRHVHDSVHIGSLPAEHVRLYGDLLIRSNEDVELELILRALPEAVLGEDHAARLRADLMNPWREGPYAADVATWASVFTRGALLEQEPPLDLHSDGPTPFDRLACRQVGRPVLTDALVSVIFPVFRPGASLRSAVASITAQTWADLELLVVDDGSGPEYRDLFEEVAASDPRVRLVPLRENRGTYGARNVALSLARGRFVTFQDHDDWSHPRRIERQVRPLLEDDSLMATHSRCARIDEDLVFSHPGYDPIRNNASSLMFRRREVLLGIGWFDEVRKGADTEYHERILAHFGRDAVDDLSTRPGLAIRRRMAGSLTRSDFRAGWHHPDRVWYRDAFRHWHRRTPRRDLFLESEVQRPFVAPRSFLPHRPEPPSLDLVLVGDWREGAEGVDTILDHVDARVPAGSLVGVAQLEGILTTPKVRPPRLPEVMDRVADGRLVPVELHEAVRAAVVVVVQPGLLQFISPSRCPWEVGQLQFLSAIEPGSVPDDVHDPDDVAERARSIFGAQPAWTSLEEVAART